MIILRWGLFGQLTSSWTLPVPSERMPLDFVCAGRRDEPGRRREQHAIAEDVAGHVAHTGRGEGHGLDIGAELAEMAFYGFPRSARGDAHLLVVIALAAAGGESIAEPMALFGRDRVGDVGKA